MAEEAVRSAQSRLPIPPQIMGQLVSINFCASNRLEYFWSDSWEGLIYQGIGNKYIVALYSLVLQTVFLNTSVSESSSAGSIIVVWVSSVVQNHFFRTNVFVARIPNDAKINNKKFLLHELYSAPLYDVHRKKRLLSSHLLSLTTPSRQNCHHLFDLGVVGRNPGMK